MLVTLCHAFILVDVLAGILQPPFFYGKKAPRYYGLKYYFLIICYCKLFYTLANRLASYSS